MEEETKISLFYRSDTGQVRSHNEDRLCVVPAYSHDDLRAKEIVLGRGAGILLAIADGMGGTNAGEVAAEIAIDTVRNSARKIDAILLRPKEIGKGLQSIIHKAHLNIRAALNEENAGMGTTLILALVTGNALYVAWCGDSRAYRYSPSTIERKNKYDLPHLKILTHDHSVVWQMVRKGKLDPNAAREHQLSNIITQSLGDTRNDPKPDSAMYTIEPGDKILICSDGLNSMLPDEFIQEFLAHDEPVDQIGNSLIEAANAKGGDDNISLILVQIEGSPKSLSTFAPSVLIRPEAITKKSDFSLASSSPLIDKNYEKQTGIIFKVIIVISILALLWFLISWAQESFTNSQKYELVSPGKVPVPIESTQMGGASDSLLNEQPSSDTMSRDTIN